MSDSFLKEIEERLSGWEASGTKKIANGAKLICPVPSVAPEAWLHTQFGALNLEQLNDLQNQLDVTIPSVYREFLMWSNGLNLFSFSLRLMGLRFSYSRSGDEARQPFDIIALNDDRPMNAPKEWFYFGSYEWDGTKVFIDLSEGLDTTSVYYCERRTTKILNRWPDFKKWLIDENDRLSALYDYNGICINDSVPTTP
ncbi:SMI1/KNR4 family protein [Cohnella abietis]|uniref:Knr4/Smi1-like domain-containing protein n=1 Tax=Cohnella abietis TaxID=2507935 RepID=A0A3T1D8K2_9BACL|nr:SMI1/KNR4 family protein [Cohnella abietis]BBI34338.1 hypothetical protein KCTCHS21_37370 [Cohnella abietis]